MNPPRKAMLKVKWKRKRKEKGKKKGSGVFFSATAECADDRAVGAWTATPVVSAVVIRQPSFPYGLPRVTQRRNDANSDSDCGALTCSTQTEGIATGQGAKSRSAVPCTRCHKLPQRQVSACLTRLARRGLRST